mmetsp:Transcript_15509/g.22681  ORF Transcript_15509/g.22681 Transcript_15509/m.22681 type:complete len:210 (+) Transcript_15509:59-688(+)
MCFILSIFVFALCYCWWFSCSSCWWRRRSCSSRWWSRRSCKSRWSISCSNSVCSKKNCITLENLQFAWIFNVLSIVYAQCLFNLWKVLVIYVFHTCWFFCLKMCVATSTRKNRCKIQGLAIERWINQYNSILEFASKRIWCCMHSNRTESDIIPFLKSKVKFDPFPPFFWLCTADIKTHRSKPLVRDASTYRTCIILDRNTRVHNFSCY